VIYTDEAVPEEISGMLFQDKDHHGRRIIRARPGSPLVEIAHERDKDSWYREYKLSATSWGLRLWEETGRLQVIRGSR